MKTMRASFSGKTQVLSSLVLLLSLFSWSAAYAQITPSGDSYTNTADPTTNYGAKTLLDVDGATQITYIQFNLASIPAGATVSQATLKLYVNAVTTAGSFNVDYVNGAWTESTIDASNAPALGTTIASDVAITTADKNQYILIDITPAVQAWLSGSTANDGIALVANSTFNATFDSKENTTTSHPAELDIVFGTITGVTTASGSGLTGGGTSGTLNLGLLSTCASGQVLEWNGSAWACATAQGTGTVTSVGSGLGLTGGPITGSGTLSINTSVVPQLAAANTFKGNQTITGDLTVNYSGTVTGLSVAGGSAYYALTATGDAVGALGNALATGGYGVVGSATGGRGVYGIDEATSGASVGVYGQSNSSSGNGVVGQGANGVQGISASSSGTGGVFTGYSAPSGSGNDGTSGVEATGGSGDETVGYSTGGAGVFATGGLGSFTAGAGGSFTGGAVAGGDGVDATSTSGYAGGFTGDVYVSGTLYAGTKDFRIDHPLDPANKYLVHASVESSEMKNIYDGMVTTDGQGEATVQLPDWFEVLNADFRYQLTVIGQFAQAIVAGEIQNHQFQIKTNAPNVKVSWQVTGVRQDAFAKAHPLVVEEEKEARLKGYYIHPDLYGAPEEKQIEWARHPQMMKKIQQIRQAQQHRAPRSGSAPPAAPEARAIAAAVNAQPK